MMSNKEIRRQFSLYAELLLLHGKEERLSRLLSGAAYRLRNADEPVVSLDKKELLSLFRMEITGVIEEIKRTGYIAALDELVQLTPSGLIDMMRIKGLGGKKLHALWHLAKIDDVEKLLQVCKAGALNIPGFGAKTQANIIAAIEAMNESQVVSHYGSIAELAENLELYLRQQLKTDLVSLCGDIRRQATTVNQIEFLAAIPPGKFTRKAVGRFLTIQSQEENITRGHTIDEIPFTLYHTTSKEYALELFTRTGNHAHVEKVLARITGTTKLSSEQAIYKKAGLPFIVPEMREDVAEWDYQGTARDLLQPADITGVVHNHTDWSDGVDTLEHFVTACKKKGYQYCVISDHSKNAFYAGGLKEEKITRQIAAIDALNKKMAAFKIFKSIECDILVSGELDYSSEVLSQFDLVITSIHQQLRMDEQKATRRIIKAIENPYTTILGHMTGRQLLIRPGYPLDFKKVIDACAANGVVIEINANPYRLDMDWTHIPYALKKGVMISVNPDAHSIAEIDNIRWGVSAARKGGLTKEMTWNAQPLQKIEQWLRKKRKQHPKPISKQRAI